MIEYLRQTDEAAFSKIIWNRPVSRIAAGRLLLVGGHRENFSLVQAVYAATQAAGIGECRVALPDSLRTIAAAISDSRLVVASPAGSIGRGALEALLTYAGDGDGLMFGGNLSANSETTILVEGLLQKYNGPAILFDDALRVLRTQSTAVDQPQRLIIASMPQLFEIAGALGVAIAIRPDGGLQNKLEIIQAIAERGQTDYAIFGPEIIIHSHGKTSVTPNTVTSAFHPGMIAGVLATFWLQNQAKPYEGLTSGAFVLRQTGLDVDSKLPSTVLLQKLSAAINKLN